MTINFDAQWQNKLVERFIKYIKIHSTSDHQSPTTPSTATQWDMANLLYQEMQEIGLEDVSIDSKGYVFGYLPSNTTQDLPCIGFLAHYDTTSDFNGKDIKPQIFDNYQGGDLLLNPETGFTLSPAKFKDLNKYIGQDLICTDGTTLLSADDKAGVAEIITAAEYLVQHPEIAHGRIAFGFNPDEEIGRGAHHFDVQKFGAVWAYTMDGSEIGELEHENFNAFGAEINFKGLSVHPGYAYQKMRNALLLAQEFMTALPENQTPATTQNREGFYHITQLNGDVTEAKITLIGRDFDDEGFQQRKDFLQDLVSKINAKYQDEVASISIENQYLNMHKQLHDKMHIVALAEQAMQDSGIKPIIKPIRGGTDGSQLSYMGLPCPNIFAGGHYFHGPYEFVPKQSMYKAAEVIIRIANLLTKG
jgi:tripeptide aminopeptidase